MERRDKRWLLTNGLGGYSLGSASGQSQSADEALFVAVVRPPLQRRVCVRHLHERVYFNGRWVDLSGRGVPVTFEYDEQRRAPIFRFQLGGYELRKMIWMHNREAAVYVQYHWPRQAPAIRLQVCPAVPHSPETDSPTQDEIRLEHEANGFAFHIAEGERPWLYCRFDHPAKPVPVHQWRRMVWDTGTNPQQEWQFLPAALEIDLAADDRVTLYLGLDRPGVFNGCDRWNQLLEEKKMIVARLPDDRLDSTMTTLALGAEQFIVERATRISRHSMSLLSGYPDLTDDGWDILIALPGVLLPLKLMEKTRRVLSMLKEHARQGVLPGRFPARPGEPDETRLDAGLWYFHAVYEYWMATRDGHFLEKEYPFLIQLLNAYIKGTAHGVKMDPEDGLLINDGGQPARTWMNRRAGAWEATPRIGKAVEVQALWFSSVRILHEIAVVLGSDTGVEKTADLAGRIAQSFQEQFWLSEAGYLADGIFNGAADEALRANQVVTVGLPFSPLDETQITRLLEKVDSRLLTPYGLRTLSPDHPAYCGRVGAHPLEAAGAWHNGTIHPWLIWPYVRGALRAGKPPAVLLEHFAPLFEHLHQDLLGHLPEAFEGDPPHRPVGAPASLISLAAALQCYRLLKSLVQGE